MNLRQPTYEFAEEVYCRLTGRRGLINNIIYEAEEFYFYTVSWETGEIDKAKETELIDKGEFEAKRIIGEFGEE